MFLEIQKRLFWQQWLDSCVHWWNTVGWVIGCLMLLCHRLFAMKAVVLLVGILLVPIVAYLYERRRPIPKSRVLAYAERVSGDTGWVYFGEQVQSSGAASDGQQWDPAVAETWKQVEPPKLLLPIKWSTSAAAIAFALAMGFVPLRESMNSAYPSVVQSELQTLKAEVEAFESLLQSEDEDVQRWMDGLNDIEEGMPVGSALRQLDALSEELHQRQSEAMSSLEKAMDALEDRKQSTLTEALQSLQAQNLFTPADGTALSVESSKTLSMAETAQSSQGNSQEGTSPSEQTAEQSGNSTSSMSNSSQIQQNSQQQTGSSTEAEGNGTSQESAQRPPQESATSSSESVQSESEQQLQQQLQDLQAQLSQQMSPSNANSSSTLKQLSNQELQVMMQQSADNPASTANGAGQIKGEGGESCLPGEPNCMPGTGGGETAPLNMTGTSNLTGQTTQLQVLSGVATVDWNNSVQFGSMPGQANGVQDTAVHLGGAGTIQSVALQTQTQIAPQHRQTVQKFFSTSSSSTPSKKTSN